MEARHGNEPARTRLFRMHVDHVTGVLVNLVGMHGDLPDLVHEVFLVAFRDLERLLEPRAFRSWLTGIAVNKARHALRSRRRRWWLRFMPAEEVPTIVSEDTAPEIREALRAAEEIIATLEPDHRIAFTLRYLQQMPLAEISTVCGVSLATVKRRIAAARKEFLVASRNNEQLEAWVGESQ